MDAGRVTVNIVDHRVYVAATLPRQVFRDSDLVRIRDEFVRSARVADGRSEVGLQGALVMPDETAHDGRDVHSVLVLGVAVFVREPARVTLLLDRFFRARAGRLHVVVSRGGRIISESVALPDRGR